MRAMPQPVLVLVNGGPACGKTTLGKRLSDELGLPIISRDLLKAGLAVTFGEVDDPAGRPEPAVLDRSRGGRLGQAAFAALDRVLQSLLADSVSLIVEQAWSRGLAESRLQPYTGMARVVQLHCRLARSAAQARFAARAGMPGRDSYPDAEIVEMMQAGTYPWHEYETPLDLPVPTLRIDTQDGYDPAMELIVAWVWRSAANLASNS